MKRQPRHILMWPVFAVLALVSAYLLAAWILGNVSTQSSSQFAHDVEPCHEVYVVSNGVHLNIVLPIASEAMDWAAFLPESLHGRPEKWVQIGWGSRAFYTQVPTWSDLTPKIAAQALFFDDAVLNVQAVNPPNTDNAQVRRLTMCQQELKHVSDDIAAQFASTQMLSDFTGFYPAHGHYTPLMTCNEWLRVRLQHRSMPKWSPFDGAILHHLNP